jgi:hypothetical protein
MEGGITLTAEEATEIDAILTRMEATAYTTGWRVSRNCSQPLSGPTTCRRRRCHHRAHP